MVNKHQLLYPKTIELMRVCSEQFERKQDRSFMILWIYSITPDSVVPVS